VNKNNNIDVNGFATSLLITAHPLIKTGKKTKLLYFSALEKLAHLCAPSDEYTNARLLQYRKELAGDEAAITLNGKTNDNTVKMAVDDFLKPWKRERCLMLLCDIALIVTGKTAVKKASVTIAMFLNQRKQEKLNELYKLLYNEKIIPPAFAKTKNLITQFRNNHKFLSLQEMRIIVTANVSAGKSTFINALVGKPVTKAAQEACTTNLCFLYNKPFEDDRVHLFASPINLNATYNELINAEKESKCSISSFFRTSGDSKVRVCLIDTPGVNSAENRSHGKLARNAIIEEDYDKLIYILNACYLDTTSDIKHLKYVYKNVPNEKIIFVLNQLDKFNITEDSISESIEVVKSSLLSIGYKNPVICPFSARFSFLLKMKRHNEILTKKDERYLQRCIEDFNEPEYDLSIYYNNKNDNNAHNSDDFIKMSYKSGLYSLENLLFGENEK
jgi:ribosome biogenesis GTPase A